MKILLIFLTLSFLALIHAVIAKILSNIHFYLNYTQYNTGDQ